MRLSEHVVLVGSGRLGLGLTHTCDCNVYLVHADGEAALVDAGCGLGSERILAAIRMSGVAPETVCQVLLTHAHADHAAGAAGLAHALGAEVVAPARSAAALRAGDEEAISLAAARRVGLYPPEVRLRPTAVAREVDDGARVHVGSLALDVVATPGHADDHVAFVLRAGGETALLCGDTILADGRVLLQSTPDCRAGALAESIVRLAGFQPAALFPGHFGPLLSGAHGVLEQAAAICSRLGIPPSAS
jgi:hydroxyacylglutathione hydrolase